MAPKQILPGGTLGWIGTDGHAYQCQNIDGTLKTIDHGLFRPGTFTARELFSRFDPGYLHLSRGTDDPQIASLLQQHHNCHHHASLCHRDKYEEDLACRCCPIKTPRRKARNKRTKKRHR
jgi:hypothetical protein